MGRVALLIAASVWAMRAQDPAAAMEASLAKQRAALELQRASVRAQAGAARQVDPEAGFFTVPWPLPVSMLRSPAPACDPLPTAQAEPLIAAAATREGLKPELLRAVIEKESAWVPCAVSPKGAQGLMQLMPETAAGLGVKDPFDPAESISGGAKFLRQLLDRYSGSTELALAAYNAGPGNVNEAGGIPQFPETINYVSRILSLLPSPASIGSASGPPSANTPPPEP